MIIFAPLESIRKWLSLSKSVAYLHLSLRVHQRRKYCLHWDSHLHREWMVPAIDFRCDHSDRRCYLGQVHQTLTDLAPGCDRLMNLFGITNHLIIKRFYWFCSSRTFFLLIQIFCIFLLLWLKRAYGDLPLCDVCSLDFCSLIWFRSSTLSSRNLIWKRDHFPLK